PRRSGPHRRVLPCAPRRVLGPQTRGREDGGRRVTASLPTQRVPFNVLAPGVQAIRPELDAAITRVLDRGWFLMGPELEEFERQFAASHGPRFAAVGLGTGTDALRIGLLARGIPARDEALVTA